MSLHMFSQMERSIAGTERKIVKFAVGDIHCAIDIMHVREIIQPKFTSPLRSKHESIVGVLDHRNAAIPVVDLRARLGVTAKHHAKEKWIIIAVDDQSIALVVDMVFGVSTVEPNQRRDHSSLGNSDVDWASKVYGDSDGLLFEIDVATLAGEVTEI